MEEKYLKRQRMYKTIMLVALTAFITFILTAVYLDNTDSSASGTIQSLITGSSDSDNLTTSLKNIEAIMKKYYLNDYDEKKPIDGAISAYI